MILTTICRELILTRINLVDPVELTDQHLIAEYRELFMIGSNLQRSLQSTKWTTTLKTLPQEFTLNKGHVKFFFDKGLYLDNRYTTIINEMKARGFNPDPSRRFKRFQWPPYLYNDWIPSERDKNVVRDRIAIRISQKPEWYRTTPHKPFDTEQLT